MTTVGIPTLELEDIQGGILDPRPSPYVGRYFLLRIDDRHVGRELLRRLIPVVAADAATPDHPRQNVWVNLGFTYQGLKALGVPPDSLDSFAPEFQEGMAARAELLGDVGESAPAHWEAPLGTPDVHVTVACLSPDAARLEAALAPALTAIDELSGVEIVFRQDCYQLPTGRTSFGFKDGISNPQVEGGPPGPPSQERPVKAGEFILGYPDETGNLPPMPYPEVLGRNGTYAVFRKLHTRVAAFRSTSATTRTDRKPRNSSRRRWSDAGRAALHWRSAPTGTTPRWERTRSATTTSSTSTTTSAASSARRARTPGG